jgi:outer membrane protein assembly factor BamB
MKIPRSFLIGFKIASFSVILIGLVGCPGKPPDIGQLTGPNDGPINVVQTFYITGNDPGNQEIQYHFDWGDGVTSSWTALYPSGTPVSDTHTFTTAGEKSILAQAKNSRGKLSNWSSPKIFFATSGEAGIRRRFIEINVDEDTAGFVSTPAIGEDGTIYVGCSFGHFHAIDSNGTSKTKFTHPEESEFISSPAIGPDGTIYVGVEDSLYAFNSNLGVVWRFPTSGDVSSSPAIGSDGTIYLHSDDGNLYALSNQGTELWRGDTTVSGGYSSPAVGPDGSIYVGGDNGYLFRFLSNGNEKWHFYAESPIYSSPTLDWQGRVYFGTEDRGVFCVDSTDSLLWRYPASGATSSPVLDNNGNVFVGTENGELICINPDGSERWIFSTGGDISSTPAVRQDGVIYFRTTFTDDDSLFAIDQNDSLLWAVSIGPSDNDDPIPSPTIANDGTVFIGGGNALYGLVGKSGGAASSAWPMFRHDVKHTGRLQSFKFLSSK